MKSILNAIHIQKNLSLVKTLSSQILGKAGKFLLVSNNEENSFRRIPENKGIHSLTFCSRCKSNEDDNTSLLIHCSSTRQVCECLVKVLKSKHDCRKWSEVFVSRMEEASIEILKPCILLGIETYLYYTFLWKAYNVEIFKENICRRARVD